MRRVSGWRAAAGMAAVVVACGVSVAGEAEDLATLEARLAQQRARIAALQAEVAGSTSQDMDAARVGAMKQQIREVLGDGAFRESLMPATLQAGYDRGFFIRSTDEKFSLRLNGRMQFRWTHYGTRRENRSTAPGIRPRHDRTGFDLPRVYLGFSGHAYTRDLTYALILDASEYRAYDAGVLHAWVNYRFSDALQLRAGIMRVAGTRANVNTAMMQMVETPVFDAVFALPRGLGVRLWGKLKVGDLAGQYRLDVVNTFGTPGTRTITTDEDLLTAGHDNNPAVYFHTVWNLLAGYCTQPSDEVPFPFASCDLGYHEEPALNVGLGYGFDENYHDGVVRVTYPRKTFFRPGGFGVTSSEGVQMHQVGVDVGLKYRGFSATFEYAARMLDVRRASRAPLTPLFAMTGDDSTSVQHGGYLQCGYFLPVPGWERKFEVVGRVEGISFGTGGQEATWAYAGGLNYYIDGHRVKLQTDVTKVVEAPVSNSTVSLANVNDDALIWRVQLQVAF
jgi:hypothetical protein